MDSIKEQSLWQFVIVQAVLDVIHTPTNKRAIRDREQTIKWFSMGNADFRLVCSLAGVEPSKILKSFKYRFGALS